MSTILKALRRLEEDEKSGRSASLEQEVLSPAESARRPRRSALMLGIAAGVSLAVTSGVIVYALSRLSPPGEPAVETPPAPARVHERPASRPAVAAPPERPVPVSADRIRTTPVESGVGELPVEPGDSVAEAARIAVPGVEPDPPPVVSAAATLDRAPPAVAVLEPRNMPIFSVSRTIWHPDPARRVAVVKLLGRPSQRLGEGDVVAGFTVVEIGLTGVELERDGVVLKRRVGAK